MTDIKNYLSTILPREHFLVEVLLPTHPHFSKMMDAYACEIISVPMYAMEAEHSWYSPGDILLVDGFRKVFTEDHFGGQIPTASWTSQMTHELQYTVRRAEELQAVGEEMANPRGGFVEVGDTSESLQRLAARRLLEEGKTLYAMVALHSVVGKVLQTGS